MTDIALNFTGRDFSAEYERLLTLLRSELPEYTDLNYSDPGMVILSIVARETDQLNYYIDRVAQEGFLQTAVFKQSVLDLGRIVDYLATLASPASTVLRFTREDEFTEELTIPAYTTFTRSDGMEYVTSEDVTLYEGDSYVDVIAFQGTVVTETVPASSFYNNEWSEQRRYSLPENTVSNLFQMYHIEDEEVYWDNTDTFWRSTGYDRRYMLELSGDDTVNLITGNGTFGADLTDIDTIYLRYLTTYGPQGNCGTNRITGIPPTYNGKITCTNTELATGGAYAESLDSLRFMIPAVTRTQRRGVIKEDYQALLNHVPGILASQVLDRNDTMEYPHLYLVIYIVPDGGGTMSTYLRNLVMDECMAWGHLGRWGGRYLIRDVVEVPIDITAVVGLSANQNVTRVRNEITANFTTLFSPENQTIAGVTGFQDIFDCIMDVSGVAYVDFTTPTNNVIVSNGQIATLGTLTLTFRE